MHASKPAPLRIRLATEDDAAGVLAVYAPYIATPVTFEEEVPALDDFRARMGAALERYPYLVAVAGAADEAGRADAKDGGGHGRVVGYAYAHAQHERAAYGWNAELSVYLSPEAQGRGLGGALYGALVDLLRLQGVKTVYALVTAPNEASERLHAAFGFELMGLQRNAGHTCGAWRDVAWLMKQLGPFDADPAPIEPFPALAAARPDAVRNVLDRANAQIAARNMRVSPREAEA